LLRKRKRKPAAWRPSQLNVPQILRWADAFHQVTSHWPSQPFYCLGVPGALLEKWSAIDNALRAGLRGLNAGSSLARLLAEHRGVRNPAALPRLSIRQVLTWADEYHQSTGEWPQQGSKPELISNSNGENWQAISQALRHGLRGLPKMGSLAHLLAKRRGVRNVQDLSLLTEKQVLAWADAYFKANGHWPQRSDGEIPGSQGETWHNVNQALVKGLRGFSGGSSLATLLTQHRKVRNTSRLPHLTLRQILLWADGHFERYGQWPKCRCREQTIEDSPGEQWFNIDQALRKGLRGLPGGSSLARLLAHRRAVPLPKVAKRA
jgi:hypothetical protein